ncbi:hypothetical protein DIE15_12210 [Burkholderia sp. Bp9031]|uniref:glycosyl hydrolase family 28-related protein n=1 Tax=Burkholderia sp. Bp9031 TaxID=2184566 RepID=UPI000F5E0060|nr:glycosyl hydrolase family 28-related protein [Burkholderia sp. Bp9031]RQZ17230.1 hypothetical protein DIE15_12210 [Burkholderia sp. Bp9031]
MASILPNGKTQFIDQNGKPLAYGYVTFYAPGTTTKKDTWQDAAMTQPNTNPVVLDSRGQATIWGSGTYRQIVKDWNGVQIWDQVVADLSGQLSDSGGSSIVGFLQVGPSPTPRTAQDKMRDTISVKDYGAVGDGVTDDTAAIQRAINAAIARKAMLYFPCGNYLVSSNLNVSNASLKFHGDGLQQSILTFSNGAGIVVDNSGITTIRKPVEMTCLSLLTTTVKTGVAITFTGSAGTRYGQQLLLRDVEIAGVDSNTCWGTGASIVSGGGQSTIHRCIFNGGGSAVRSPQMISINASKGVHITESWLFNFDDGVYITGGSEGITVRDNMIQAGRRGVVMDNNNGNLLVMTGNDMAVRERGVVVGTGAAANGSNSCNISDNFIIAWDPADGGTYSDFVGVEFFSQYNQIHSNEFYKNSVGFTCTAIHGGVSASRTASVNSIRGNVYNTVDFGLVLDSGVTATEASFWRAVGTTPANSFVNNGNSTSRVAFLDSDTFFSSGGLKACVNGVAAPREVRLHSLGGSTWDSRFVGTGGTSGSNGGGSVTISGVNVYGPNIGPSADNSSSSGYASLRWSVVYAASGAINTSDARLKSAVRSMTAAEIAAAQQLAAEIGIYQFLAAISEKGADGARLHTGTTVQRVIDVMQSHGLDPLRYAFICYDKWDAVDAILDEDGGIVMPAREAGDLYSFRDNEFQFFLLAGMFASVAQQQTDNEALTARVTALEAKAA